MESLVPPKPCASRTTGCRPLDWGHTATSRRTGVPSGSARPGTVVTSGDTGTAHHAPLGERSSSVQRWHHGSVAREPLLEDVRHDDADHEDQARREEPGGPLDLQPLVRCDGELEGREVEQVADD